MTILKRYTFLLFIILLISCNDENAFDCVKTVGNTSTYTIDLPSFNEIEIIGDIQLYLENSTDQIVSLTTGENLFPKINFEVVDGLLTVSDNNRCNWARKYGNTILTIKSNNITAIKNSGSRDINTIGTYNYSGKFTLTSVNASGDYYLNIKGDMLRISSNKVSNFYINGTVDDLFVGFYSGQGRFEGEKLYATSVKLFHRGSNDIIVKPLETLTGSIESFGNIVVHGQPSLVDVEQNGEGEIIYK